MGKGKPRAVEKGVLGQFSTASPSGALNIPQGPVYYPTEEEFKDPLDFIYKIRPEAEPYGICRIVPPKGWKPPFALDLDSFTFPTKTQAIHQLQARSAACDPETFELEYGRFLENHCGKRSKKKLIFEGEELDLCKLFNAVKRYGGYDKAVKEKKWGEIFRFVRSAGKISECSKHVLCQLYREHLYDYEKYNNQLNGEKATRKCKRGAPSDKNQPEGLDVPSSKRIRRNPDAEAVKVVKLKKEEEFDQICEQCRSGLHGEVMLLCDRCNRGWHIYCLSPPLKIVPPGNWYCLECLNSDKDSFGFVPGKRFSLESFRRLAERAKRKWFRSACVSRLQAEKKFWEIVEGSLGEVEVMYGSDLDTSLYGSGFPRVNDPRPPSVEVEVWDEYSSSPWNLNNLPKLKGSMLRAVHDNIAGVMVPWLYIGMLFSSFCWHFEDHCFYSMNYLHWGEPKCWYSVPGSEAESFEKVMRNSLPDLFDAQPDLLFQLVTMLNPSVLQKNGVPVYTVLQEAGNFVITFPKSFHGGFNFGFNCAEAVNFAPADWLPHGGFGAQLYKLYRKAAVLSHEELLCVVAKTEYDSKVSPFLRKELLRVISKEKTWRERLWKNGIFSSSVMSPRKHPEFVGTEEDPTCIICQQHLYLSAVVCRCRPSSFVCLEHWEHLCECHPRKHHLLYRHTLAELNDLVLMTDRSKEKTQSRNIRRQLSCSNESSAITKKVKGGHMTHAQLAEEWLLGSCKILQIPYSGDAFKSALKQAEQFLWAGPEMNAVRDMTENLHEAMKWAEDVRDCLLKVVDWSHHDNEAKKVSLEDVNSLLNFDPLPCNEPGQIKLKVYAEEARSLVGEINSALSTCSLVTVAELEVLESRCSRLPLYLEERERLTEVISLAKVWIDKVKRCIAEKKPAAIEVDIIQKLKSEMSGLQVQLPEMEILLDLLRHVESWQIRCHEILDKPISLKKLEVFLQESDNFTISIPELKLLRQHYCDAMSWISRLRGVLVNIQERDDQENVVEELTCLLKAGKLLHVQVDELPFVEVELKKAYCRVKALKVQARGSQMSLDSIKQLMTEAIMLQIKHENTFMDMSGVLAAAISWEERAKHVLNNMAPMSEFEDVIRKSEHIFVILPSLHDVKDAVAVAKSWRRRCQPFMISALPDGHMPSSLLKVDLLKELVFDSKLLRISLEEPVILKKILRNCEKWEDEANSVLELVESLLNICDIDTPMIDGLIEKIDQLLMTIKSSRAAGLSLGFSFHEIPKLQDACCTLQWCLEALYLCCSETSLEEVEGLLEDFEHLPGTFASSSLRSSLIEGVRWLKKAMEVISMPSNETRCRLSDVEEVLEEAQRTRFSFHLMVGQLVDAIGKHKSWQEQVHVFFNPTLGEHSWSQLLQLKELGISDAFRSPELDTVLSEVEKVEQWLLQCEDIFALSNGDVNPLSTALIKVKHTLDRSLNIYNETNGCKVRGTCVCCCSETEDQILACSQCKDWYHISCLTPALVDKYVQEEYVCPYCVFFENGAILGNAGRSVIHREKHPELKMLRGLLSDANGFHVWIEERDIAAQLVERALACKMCLKEIVDQALDYLDEDLSSITERLKTALKAVAVAGVYDHQGCCDLELALSQNAWKIRVKKLLDGSQKPLIQQIQRLLKEGLQMNIPSDEHFMQKLAGVKNMGMHWADNAKKVALDSGALGLDEVFKLIKEGENLPVHFEKELKLLKDRSVLYCICRKPNDQRAMIACDCCDEWYHLDCINLPLSLPKVYICPACKPITDEFTSPSLLVSQEERSSGAKCEPQTPPQHTKSKTKKPRKSRSNLQRRMMVAMDLSSILKNYSGFDRLLWRNKKPFRRAARKRAQLENLSPFFHTQQ